MGFMVRVILGLALVFTICVWIECAPSSSWRHIRQVLPEEEAPELPITSDRLSESNKEDISNNNVINQTSLVNDSTESSVKFSVDKPKTESIHKHQPQDGSNSKGNKEAENDYADEHDDNVSVTKSSQSTTEEVPEIKHTVTQREDSARSIDINKYVSPEFHNKNNVFSLSVSPDTEKYTNLHNDILNFSTTESYDFDKKQQDIEKGVKQKLKYIDDEFEQVDHNFSSPKDDKILNITEILDTLKDNDTTTDLHYIKFRNITSNYNKVKNKINKETDIESGETINYNTSFNKTHVYDETPKDYKNKISSHNDHVDSKFTQKFTTERIHTENNDKLKEVISQKDGTSLTKPPLLNKTLNQNHLISNKIETEVQNSDNLKIKDNFTYTSTTQPTTTTTKVYATTRVVDSYDKYGKENAITISKRGSTKYADTIKPTLPTTTRSKHYLANKLNQTVEEVVQENQVYPVHVPAPNMGLNTERYASADLITETAEPSTTSADFTTSTLSILESTSDFFDETTTMETTTSKSTTFNFDSLSVTDETEFTDIDTTTSIPYITTTNLPTTTDMDVFKMTTDDTEDYRELTHTEVTHFKNDENNSTNNPETDDRFDTGRGFNFSNTGFDYQTLEDKSSNKSVLPTTFPQNVTTTPTSVDSTTTEMIPTTTDYRDNVIIKHTEAVTTTKQPIETRLTPKSNATIINKETNETNKESDKHTFNTQNNHSTTRRYSMRTHTLEQTSETTPFIIPLNISMYEADGESTTINGNLGMEDPDENNAGKIAAIAISSIGAVCLVLLAGLLIIMRKRHKRFNYGQRCTPVSLDAYSVDNVSVYNSVRRKGAIRASKRSYGNPAFDDPASITNPLNFPALARFANKKEGISAEFEEVPQVTAQTNELPEGCETKNRYANVIPLPETRVFLTPIEGYPNSDYINANYVTGPKSTKSYYIACQAPMQNTVEDFWRMIWEQQSKVILMLTHLFENGSEKCVDYLPPSEVLDCHRLFGDFQITLKNREVKEKYVISVLQLKNMVSNSWREITHLWYLGWPEKGVPLEANSLIAFLIEARSYIKALPSAENGKPKTTATDRAINGSVNSEHCPVVVHCSPGTGRTGTVIACDIAIREFELARQVDIPKTVYRIRRDRASSVQTKEQYEFIYNVITLYATKLTGGVLDSL